MKIRVKVQGGMVSTAKQMVQMRSENTNRVLSRQILMLTGNTTFTAPYYFKFTLIN